MEAFLTEIEDASSDIKLISAPTEENSEALISRLNEELENLFDDSSDKLESVRSIRNKAEQEYLIVSTLSCD